MGQEKTIVYADGEKVPEENGQAPPPAQDKGEAVSRHFLKNGADKVKVPCYLERRSGSER